MRIALTSLLPLLTGCIALARLGSGATTTSPDGAHYVEANGQAERVGPYWGPECVRIGAPTNRAGSRDHQAEPTKGKQPNLSHDPADQILRLVCVDTIMADHDEPERNTWVTQHFRFDELYFDHFTASMMLVQCLEASSCLDAPHVQRPRRELNNPMAERMRAEQDARPPNVWQYYQAGMMRWYADRLDPAEVARRLAALPLPAEAAQVYLRLVEQARAGVIAMTDALAPEAKALFVELPIQVFEQRSAELGKSGKAIAELGVLIERAKAERAAGTQSVSDETLARLSKLRIAHHAACKQTCTRGAVVAAITKQLFWAHVSRGDAPAATAEAKLLVKLDPSAAEEIADRQTKAIGEVRGRVSRVESARRQGVEADSARATANGSLLDLGDGRYVYRWHRDFKIHWESLVPDARSVGPFEGKVAGLQRQGALVTVRFHDRVSSWQEGTGCRETRRVDSISRDGRINYRRQCSGSKTRTERHKVPAVTMPASEAIGLAPGDEVSGFAALGSNQERLAGRVGLVRRGTRLVRLRDLRL